MRDYEQIKSHHPFGGIGSDGLAITSCFFSLWSGEEGREEGRGGTAFFSSSQKGSDGMSNLLKLESQNF